MSYEIEYDTTDRSEAEVKAIKDVEQWLGVKNFNKLVKILGEDQGRTSRFMVLLGISLQGIEGYPAEVLLKKYWNPQQELNLEIQHDSKA